MNIFQRFMVYVFNRQYVILLRRNGTVVRRVYKLGDYIFANPYLPDTRTQILIQGKVKGEGFALSWLPITKEMKALYLVKEGGERNENR